MITADAITDEQLRDLRDTAPDLKTWFIATFALDENPEGNPVEDRTELVAKARARCAVLLNGRATKDGDS